MADNQVPLIVDIDGTLLRSDLLWESLASLAVRHPLKALLVPFQLLRGRPALKAFLARETRLEIELVPLSKAAVELIEAAEREGRRVILASGSPQAMVDRVRERVGADEAWGTDSITNLTGSSKLLRIQESYGAFDYAGNSWVDLPLWREARRPIAVNPKRLALHFGKRARPDLEVVEDERVGWRAWLRALRPHHWAKNTLMFLPALAAHLEPSPELAVRLLAGFAAFCAMTSAVYLTNDIADLSSDRTHATKRHRPLAAGEIAISHAIVAALLLAVASAALAWYLAPIFAAVLASYLALTSAYTALLKRKLIVDVITLATLYTIRVVAGAVLVQVPLSRWFLAFSIFLFLSLALVKRVVELKELEGANAEKAAGRRYQVEDLGVLIGLGTAAAAASALVYCLYITSDDVLRLYDQPDALWIGLPLFLYWIARLWVLASRGVMHEDPVTATLRDRATYAVLVGFLLTVWLAS
ncbi:MAG: UbiA family prenyltransferase [Gemmatimonadetes bacterium]|uniref:UbiA family prenyltransferase n=1 Tax=Candidatus Kutchimonas denitrificans TaxID=3056748 RepID=A0AAE5CAI3_9BACT|nr:UbiA family prenyltransferase [Gemmatimonadota bacterium]NIR76531.1 UbiA family prenyltransferase [Candidatus Kutchimonas denitrificans]NIS03349.1 UbiA family prenyltransferase [Gemmatimonadota bacterium]NIT69210.1 UbiA family prenyltransferase [Gemmatimonadota bacterium]NIU54602.1 UbiA family prenyltransferase [Gemmatimonadota bacterium]